MKKTIALTAVLAALSAGAVGTALAADTASAKLYGPQPISEVRAAGEGIVVGTVTHVDRNGFILADASDRVRVRGHIAADAVQPGQQATVAGRMDDGALKARQIVRDDGTSAQSRDSHRRSRDEARRDRRDDPRADRRADHRRDRDPDRQRSDRR
jgi:hypothetical protein